MKKYIFFLLMITNMAVSAQDCDELPKRNGATVFPISYSLELGGVDESITFGDHNDFTFTNGSGDDQPFSLFIWMNRANSTNNHILISKYPDEYLLALVGTTLRIQMIEWFNEYIGRSAPMSVTNSWIGIAVTYSGNNSSTGIKIYSVTPSGTVTQIDNANLNNNYYDGMQNRSIPLKIGSSHQPIWFFEGKLACPLIANKELSIDELKEIAAAQNGDYRKVSFTGNIVSAWYFPNGQNDYPTYIDYKSGHDGTMTNMESGDIATEIP